MYLQEVWSFRYTCWQIRAYHTVQLSLCVCLYELLAALLDSCSATSGVCYGWNVCGLVLYGLSRVFTHCHKTNLQLFVCNFLSPLAFFWSGHCLESDSGNNVCAVTCIFQHSSYWRHVSSSFGPASAEPPLKMHSALTQEAVRASRDSGHFVLS